MKYTMKTGKKHSNKNLQEEKLTILPFVTQYQPSVPGLKNILMKHWHLIENQPLLRQIYKEPPIISYKRGRSLTDILVKAKLWELKAISTWVESVCQACQPFYDISKLSKRKRTFLCCVHLLRNVSVTWAREIRNFHVVVVQWRQRNVQNIMMHV